jgi:Family of unknown function (DUF6573)
VGLASHDHNHRGGSHLISDTNPILTRIDRALAAHQAGGTYADDTVSSDAMRWTTNPIAGSDPFGEPVDAYSRAQAIADGLLVEVAEGIACEAGFTVPVAVTAAAWADCVAWTDADNRRKGTVQDEQGRLWDVLWMTRHAIRRAPPGTNRVPVQLYRVPREGRGIHPQPVSLVARCGPGDHGEPVITIMLPGED